MTTAEEMLEMVKRLCDWMNDAGKLMLQANREINLTRQTMMQLRDERDRLVNQLAEREAELAMVRRIHEH